MFLKVSLVSEEEFWRAYEETGGVYFIRERDASHLSGDNDVIKIGYTRDPFKRLSNLQVGNSSTLELVGLIAAEQSVETLIHEQLREGHIRGEWFWDRGLTTQWLLNMTQGHPIARTVWSRVEGQSVLWTWDAETQTHTKHYWDKQRGEWVPPVPKAPES